MRIARERRKAGELPPEVQVTIGSTGAPQLEGTPSAVGTSTVDRRSRSTCPTTKWTTVSFHLFKSIGTEIVGHALSRAMALDDVTRLHVVREDDHLIPYGAARLLDLGERPDAFLLARPEREARSVGAVEHVPTLDPGRDLDCLSSPPAEAPRHLPPSSIPPALCRDREGHQASRMSE